MHHNLSDHLIDLLENIYTNNAIDVDTLTVANQLLQAMRLEPNANAFCAPKNLWSEQDVVLITYGNTIKNDETNHLSALKHFTDEHCKNITNTLHILPFFPASADAGFAVKDYRAVDPTLGSWQEIENLCVDYHVMADLVINHGSDQSEWFEQFCLANPTYKDFYYTADPKADISRVTRPRTSPLLTRVETADGERYVWCTFSADQVDFNFENPAVLLEFVSIIRFYLDRGIRIFRLDAVAFLWKRVGTSCINLPETHLVIRLLRLLIEHAQPDAVVVTETNIPNRQNLEYFGNANEAHWIYNFSLPPLLVYSLLAGDCHYLKQWMMSMPPAQNGTAYFNFIASHDGIGLRPTEGLLSEREIDRMLATIGNFGGKISYRTLESGEVKPYEMNIALYDALQGTFAGPDGFNTERFTCAHAIMFALEGVPGLYIHSLVGTSNDYEGMHANGDNRSINRRQWQSDELEALLSKKNHHSEVLSKLKALLAIRIKQPAFHPNATQFTLHLGESIFGFWRQSIDRSQSIFCISNITPKKRALPLSAVNLIETENWFDLISGTPLSDYRGELQLAPYQTLWITNSKQAAK